MHTDQQAQSQFEQKGRKEKTRDLLEWQVVGEEPTGPRTAGLRWAANNLLAMEATQPAPQLQGCGHGQGKRLRPGFWPVVGKMMAVYPLLTDVLV